MGQAGEGPMYWLTSLGSIVAGGGVLALTGMIVTSPPGSKLTAAEIFGILLGGGLIVYGFIQIFRWAGNVRTSR